MMDKDRTLEIQKELKEAKGALTHVSLPLTVFGLWPVNITRGSKIRLMMYMIYHSIQVTLEFIDLAMVSGQLARMIDNLMVTGFQTALGARINTVRFHKSMHRVIEQLDKLHEDKNFRNNDEIEIFISYGKSARRFHKMMLCPACMCALTWFTTPLQNYFFAMIQNESVPLTVPFPFPAILDLSRLDIVIMIYIADLPMMWMTVCYLASYSIQFTFVSYICAQLSILTYRVKNLKFSEFTTMGEVFGHLVELHIQIIQISKDLDDSTCLALMYELFDTTVIIGLLSLNIMLNLDSAEAAVLSTLIVYIILMLALVYANCYMGEYLETEAMKLLAAYYEYEWDNLPASYQRAFIICMVQAQIPLQMTAGKFYKFSLNGFTSILKTSMAYVSMLRTMI